jgi:hypothetical protein
MMKTYVVNARLLYPSCYHSGYEYVIHAKNGVDAIKQARNKVRYDGHTRQDGPLKYTAERD